MVGIRSTKVRPYLEAGQLLKQARHGQDLSLETVSTALRLPRRQLEALEEGDFSIFHAEVYGRGAYLRYARYLAVDLRAAERLASRALSDARQHIPLHVYRPFSWFQRLMNANLLISAAVAVVALLVGGYIAWQVHFFLELPDVVLVQPASAVTTEALLAIQGRAEAEAQVRVNGQPQLLADGGVFQTELSLRPGINVIRVEAENAAGRVRVIERHVLLPRQ